MIGYSTICCDSHIIEIGPARILPDIADLIDVKKGFGSKFSDVQKELRLDMTKTNVNGGAIALGRPVGAQILANLVHGMKARNAKYSSGSACIGGGQDTAVMLKNISA